MRVEIYLYTLFTLVSIFVLNGINWQAIMRKNRVIETKLLVMLLSFSLGYLLTNFVLDFVG